MFDKTEITKKYQDPDEVAAVGEKKAQTFDLTVRNLPRAATFRERDGKSRKIKLVPSEEKVVAGVVQKVAGTGVTLHFLGGYKTVYNTKLVELIMTSTAWNRGIIMLDETDPTGFWQELGMIETKEVKALKTDSLKHPKFNEIDLNRLTPIKKDEVVEPVSQVI